jgi:hypothetical protein
VAYLTLIGAHGDNRFTIGGIGSRGYWIFRRGKTVTTRWGAVKVVRARTVEIHWVYCQEKRKSYRTVAKAKEAVKEILARFQRPSHGYTLLPKGKRILPPQAKKA